MNTENLYEFEKRHILFVLDKMDGNRTRTAEALGIGLRTLQRKLRKWGVSQPKSISSEGSK